MTIYIHFAIRDIHHSYHSIIGMTNLSLSHEQEIQSWCCAAQVCNALYAQPINPCTLCLTHLCQYVFPHVKPPWQPPNRFNLLLQLSGMHCQIICRPFQLFLLLEELSNIIYSCLLTLTVVQNLVRSNQLKVSHFVIPRQPGP